MSSCRNWWCWKRSSRMLTNRFGRFYWESAVQPCLFTTSCNRSISRPSCLPHPLANSPASIVGPPPWNLSILRNKADTTSARPAFNIAPIPAALARRTDTLRIALAPADPPCIKEFSRAAPSPAKVSLPLSRRPIRVEGRKPALEVKSASDSLQGVFRFSRIASLALRT